MPLLWLVTLICQMMCSVGNKTVSNFCIQIASFAKRKLKAVSEVNGNISILLNILFVIFHLPAGLGGVADDDKPYTSAGYTNGPGYLDHRTFNGSEDQWQPRMNLTGVDASECTLN